MKTKILEGLKTKFEGVEDAILERVAKKLSKTVTKEEDVKTAVDGVTFQSILQSYGDSRADEASSSAVKNYEAKHNIKDGKPVTAGGDESADEPAWFKAYREAQDAKMKALEAENEKREKERKIAERNTLIQNTAKELGIPEYMVKRMSFADDADIKDELTKFKQDLVNDSLLPESSVFVRGSEDATLKAEAEAWADTL